MQFDCVCCVHCSSCKSSLCLIVSVSQGNKRRLLPGSRSHNAVYQCLLSNTEMLRRGPEMCRRSYLPHRQVFFFVSLTVLFSLCVSDCLSLYFSLTVSHRVSHPLYLTLILNRRMEARRGRCTTLCDLSKAPRRDAASSKHVFTPSSDVGWESNHGRGFTNVAWPDGGWINDDITVAVSSAAWCSAVL